MFLLVEGSRGGWVWTLLWGEKKLISYLSTDGSLLRVDVWEKKWVKEGSMTAAISPPLMGVLPSRDSVVSLFADVSLFGGS